MSAAGRSPSVARPRGPSSVSESSDSMGEDRHRRTRLEGPCLEVRQEAGVLLGLLGDAIDRRGCQPPSPTGGRRSACAWRSQRRSGCRAGRSQDGRASRRGGLRRAVRSRPGAASPPRPTRPSPSRRRSSTATRGVRGAGRWRRRRRAPRSSAAAPPTDMLDQAVRREAAEHLARGLGGHAEVSGDPGRRARLLVASGHAEREQVLLGSGGQITPVVPRGMTRQDTGRPRRASTVP